MTFASGTTTLNKLVVSTSTRLGAVEPTNAAITPTSAYYIYIITATSPTSLTLNADPAGTQYLISNATNLTTSTSITINTTNPGASKIIGGTTSYSITLAANSSVLLTALFTTGTTTFWSAIKY
jgi:hypothetical protein